MTFQQWFKKKYPGETRPWVQEMARDAWNEAVKECERVMKSIPLFSEGPKRK